MGNENRWQIELLRRFGVYTFFREWEDPSWPDYAQPSADLIMHSLPPDYAQPSAGPAQTRTPSKSIWKAGPDSSSPVHIGRVQPWRKTVTSKTQHRCPTYKPTRHDAIGIDKKTKTSWFRWVPKQVMPLTGDLPKVARCALGDLWFVRKQICWHDGAPASCSGSWARTRGNSTSGTHSFWWPLQNETQEEERTETLFQDLVPKPWRPSIAHWRGSCDQDANTGTKQTSRGNGNWLSPLNSLPSNISFTPLRFAHTPLTFAHTHLIFSHTTCIPQHFYLTYSHSILTQKISHHTLDSH